MTDMRVAVFTTDDYFPPAGGAEVALGQIMKGLPDIDFDVYTAHVGLPRPRVEKDGNITLYRQPGSLWFQKWIMLTLISPFQAAWRHRTRSYACVWGMMATYGGFAAMLFKRLTNVPFLLTLQEGDPLPEIERRTRKFGPMFKRIFTTADGLQAISTFLLRWGERMGFRGKVKAIIPNGVVADRFSGELDGETRKAVRSGWGIGETEIALITTSRLVRKNGVGDVIRALAKLPKQVVFVVYGVGELENELKDLARSSGVAERVRFMGHVDYSDIPDVTRAADVFIRPSLTEGLGNSFLEAMAAGIPVIGTPVGGIPDFLKDGETGFSCVPEDPESIAEAIKRVMGLDPENKRRILLAARRIVEGRYTWDKVIPRMRQLFLEIAKAD